MATPTGFPLDAKKIAGTALVLAGLIVVYWQVFVRLIDAWIVDGNYSHGWLIIPIALYFAWERRDKLASTPLQPSWLGLIVFAFGIIVLLAGLMGSEFFLSRVSLIITLADIVLFAFLEFGASVGQPLDPALKSLTAWFEKTKARPSAKA